MVVMRGGLVVHGVAISGRSRVVDRAHVCLFVVAAVTAPVCKFADVLLMHIFFTLRTSLLIGNSLVV